MAGPGREAIEFESESDLVPRDLPSLFIRAIAWLVIATVTAAILISFLVPFPDVVEAPFLLVPKDGTDPVKAPIGGSIEKVAVAVGSDVKAGDVLFVINSQDLAVLNTRVKNLERELENSTPVSDAARDAGKAALRSAELRVSSLSGELAYMLKRKDKAAQLRQIAEDSFKRNLISQEQLIREQGQADEANRVLEALRRQLAEAKSAVAELKAAIERQEAELTATRSRLDGQLAEAKAALAWIQLADDEGKGAGEANDRRLFDVVAPFDGTVTAIGPSRPGVLIERGEELCQLAQAGAELRAELAVPELFAGRVAKNQSVKLLLDAYPYVRYGTKPAAVSWLSPTADSGRLRAHATLEEATMLVDGTARPLRAGMIGKARVLVGNRTLVDYVLEPLRQFKENVSRN